LLLIFYNSVEEVISLQHN